MKSLHGWLAKEQQVQLLSNETDKGRRSITIPHKKVAVRIHELHSLGMPVDAWMVIAEAKQLLFEW